MTKKRLPTNSNSTTGYRGVTYAESRGKYVAKYKVFLGERDTAKEAYELYLKAVESDPPKIGKTKPTEFSTFIVSQRNELGLSGREVAEKAGINLNRFYEIEKGESTTTKTKAAILKVLGYRLIVTEKWVKIGSSENS